MIDERQQELAALHALGLLAGPELAAFEAELASDPALRALVDELRAAAAALALTAKPITPPPELKQRVLAALPDAKPASAPPPKLLPLSVLIPWAVAAVFAVTGAWLGQLYLTARTEIALLHDQQALADLEIIGARHQTEAERIIHDRELSETKRHVAQLEEQISQSTRQVADARRQLVDTSARLVSHHTELNRARELLATTNRDLAAMKERLDADGDPARFKIATLTPPAPAAANSSPALAAAVVVWNPITQQGVIRVEKLPPLASDHDYQLWIVDPASPQPVDAGVFTVDPTSGDARVTFKPHEPVTNATKFVVSLERKGGAPKAEGPIVLRSE